MSNSAIVTIGISGYSGYSGSGGGGGGYWTRVPASGWLYASDTTDNVGVGTNHPAMYVVAGRTYLTISGSTAAGALELITQEADANGVAVGSVQFTDKNSIAADKRIISITGFLDGTTANNRGGHVCFCIKQDGQSGLFSRLSIDQIGRVGVNMAEATAYLHLPASTASAGTGALKFNQGILLSTPEDGVIEYNGSHYYATIGSTRYQLDQQGGGGGNGKHTVDVKTDNYSVLTSDVGHTLVMDSSSNKVFYLPAAASGDIGTWYTFVKLDTGKVTITASGTNTIDDSGAGGSIYDDLVSETFASITLEMVTATQWLTTGGKGTWVTTL